MLLPSRDKHVVSRQGIGFGHCNGCNNYRPINYSGTPRGRCELCHACLNRKGWINWHQVAYNTAKNFLPFTLSPLSTYERIANRQRAAYAAAAAG